MLIMTNVIYLNSTTIYMIRDLTVPGLRPYIIIFALSGYKQSQG